MTTPSSTLPWRQTIPVDRLLPGKDNPREDPGDLKGLEDSIRKQGLKQPLLVVPRPNSDYFDIEDGWRRYLAMREWNTEIQCVVVPQRPGENRSVRALYTALVTDVHKKGLNQIERAKGFRKLQDEFGFNASEVARQVGVSAGTVTNSLMLLELATPTQQMIIDKKISATEAQALLKRYRKTRRAKQGRPPIGPVWEPPWFAPTHQLAVKAAAMCDSMDHSMRRRYGAKGEYRGACGQCWQRCIEANYELVLKAEGWTPPGSAAS